MTAERLRGDLESVISPESVRDDILRQTSTQNALVLEEHAHDPLIDVGVFHTRVRDDRLSFEHTLPLALRDAFLSFSRRGRGEIESVTGRLRAF